MGLLEISELYSCKVMGETLTLIPISQSRLLGETPLHFRLCLLPYTSNFTVMGKPQAMKWEVLCVDLKGSPESCTSWSLPKACGTGCLFGGWNKGGWSGFEMAQKVLDTDLDFAFSEEASSSCLCSKCRVTELKQRITLIDLTIGLYTQFIHLDLVILFWIMKAYSNIYPLSKQKKKWCSRKMEDLGWEYKRRWSVWIDIAKIKLKPFWNIHFLLIDLSIWLPEEKNLIRTACLIPFNM